MTAKILDGKAMAQQVRQQLAAKVAENQTEAFLATFNAFDKYLISS